MRGVVFFHGLEPMRDGAAHVPFDPALKVGARLGQALDEVAGEMEGRTSS
jgi:hypothetical protein